MTLLRLLFPVAPLGRSFDKTPRSLPDLKNRGRSDRMRVFGEDSCLPAQPIDFMVGKFISLAWIFEFLHSLG